MSENKQGQMCFCMIKLYNCSDFVITLRGMRGGKSFFHVNVFIYLGLYSLNSDYMGHRRAHESLSFDYIRASPLTVTIGKEATSFAQCGCTSVSQNSH